MKIRLLELERELTVSKTTTTLPWKTKYRPFWEQLKAIKEENALLKKYLNSPKEPSHPPKNNDPSSSSYANFADAIKQMNKIMGFYTKAGNYSTEPGCHLGSLSHRQTLKIPASAEFFPPLFQPLLTKRPSASTKECFPPVVSPPHLARHLITTPLKIYSKCHLQSRRTNATPCPFPTRSATARLWPIRGTSYKVTGEYTDDSASKATLRSWKQAADKLASEISRCHLWRTYYFLK